MEKFCSCFTCTHLEKIEFLKQFKITSSDVDVSSNGPFGRLPDEVLMRIFNFIPPINMDNFITFIALEMVSTRFRRCVADNRKIVEEMTELVIGFHPDLPDDQYFCHICGFTIELFLHRVRKISKVIVNSWSLCQLARNQLLPLAVDRFVDKLRIEELIVNDCWLIEVGLLEKLINNVEQSLERAEIHIFPRSFWHDQEMCVALRKCPHLKSLKLCITDWNDFDQFLACQNISRFLSQLQSVEMLEISGYIPQLAEDIMLKIANGSLNVQIVRFTYPYRSIAHMLGIGELDLSLLFPIPHQSTSIGQFKIHLCARYHTLNGLPALLQNVNHSIHLKLIFLPYLEFCKIPKIVELVENAQQKNIDGMKISITFKHGSIDGEAKLAIAYHLLNAFDVPFMPEETDKWEFIRGKLSVNVNLEKMEDESLICHPYPPPVNQ